MSKLQAADVGPRTIIPPRNSNRLPSATTVQRCESRTSWVVESFPPPALPIPHLAFRSKTPSRPRRFAQNCATKKWVETVQFWVLYRRLASTFVSSCLNDSRRPLSRWLVPVLRPLCDSASWSGVREGTGARRAWKGRRDPQAQFRGAGRARRNFPRRRALALPRDSQHQR